METRCIEIGSKKVIISMIISGILLLGMIILISNNVMVFVDNKVIYAISVIVIGLVTFGSFVIFIITGIILLLEYCYNYKVKQQYVQSFNEIHKLSSEFSEIYLKNLEEQGILKIIPNEEIKCMARLGKNDEVIYNIYINIENATDDYETFLKYFEI